MAGIDQIFTRIIASVLDGRWPTEAELSHICPVSGSVNAVDGTSFTGNVSASQRAAAAVMQTSSVASENCSFTLELYQMPLAGGASVVETSFRECQDSGPRSSHLK